MYLEKSCESSIFFTGCLPQGFKPKDRRKMNITVEIRSFFINHLGKNGKSQIKSYLSISSLKSKRIKKKGKRISRKQSETEQPGKVIMIFSKTTLNTYRIIDLIYQSSIFYNSDLRNKGSPMNKTHFNKSNLGKFLKQSSKKRKVLTFSQNSQPELHIDLYNLWKAKSREEEKLISSVRKSQMFSPERIETFVKFNFRTMQNKNINYESTFRKVLERRSSKEGRIYRGTMHVIDLWSQNNMQELLGHLPYPKDRLKILKQYQRKKEVRIKTLNK